MTAALRFALVGVLAGIVAGFVGASGGDDGKPLRDSGAGRDRRVPRWL